MAEHNNTRREFLQTTLAGAAALGVTGAARPPKTRTPRRGCRRAPWARPACASRSSAPIGMKSLGGGQPGRLVSAGVCTAEEAIRYALSQDVAALVTGIDSMKVLEQNLGIARNFQKMTEDELKALLTKVKDVAGDGRHERFKSTQLFDSVHHQKQHGLTKAEVEG